MPLGKGYTVTYDGVASTTIPSFICHRVRRQLVGSRRTSFESIAGMEGAYVFPEEPGLRSIEIDASVLVDEVDTELRREALRSVAAWVNKFEMKKLFISDEPGKYDMAIFNGDADPDEWRQKGSFKLPFMCEPYSYQEELQHEDATAAGTSVDIVIDVDGTAPRSPFIVEMTAAGTSAFQSVTVNGRTWTRTTSLSALGIVTFNTKAGVMLLGANTDTDLQGTFDPDDVSMAGGSGRPPYLVPGSNTITVAMNHTGFSVDVWWRGRYA